MSRDMVRGSDSCTMEEINDVSSGSDKCNMCLNPVNGVAMDNSHLGLDNGDNNAVNSDKNKKGLDIDLNEVDNKKNDFDSSDMVSVLVDGGGFGVHNGEGILFEMDNKKNVLNSGDMVSLPVDGEVLHVHNGEVVLFDGDKKKNELDLVSNEVGCVKDSPGVSEHISTEECEEVGESGPKKRLVKVSNKAGKVASTVKGKINDNAEPDIVITVPKRKRGRPPKERVLESYTVPMAVGGEVLGVHNGEGVLFDGYKKKNELDLNSDEVGCARDLPDVSDNENTEECEEDNLETIVVTGSPEKTFARVSKKERKAASTVNGDVDVNAEPDIDATAPKRKRGRPPKTTSTFKKKVDVNADMETVVPKRNRGRPPKERKVENTEKVLLHAYTKKGGNVDSAGDEEKDEEAIIDMSGSRSEREMGERSNEYDDSEHMECGEDAAVSAHGEKCCRGRKRKMVESSVHKLKNGARKKKPNTSFDGDSEGVGRVLRSRAVLMTGDGKKNKNGNSSNKINDMTKEESAREKRKRHGLRKIGIKPLSKKIIKGSKFANMAEQQKKSSSSDGKGKDIVLKRRSTKKKLLKDRIKNMLKDAGWTIDYRPRNGKENYCDAVYVSPKGNGYWSVTRAYSILKEDVESGQADSKAVAAYFPIAEDDWNSLLRITKKKLDLEKMSKKCKGVKNQSGKLISQKKILKTKNGKEKYQLRLKHKAALRRSNGKEKKNKKRFTLLARGSKRGSDLEGEEFLLYEGQRSLLSWMIDLGTVSLGAKLKCMNSRRTKVLLAGKVTKDGIQCDCCDKILALADFEIHSGSPLGLPLQNICLDSTTSLLQCLRDSWNKYVESMSLGFHSVVVDGDDPNDDTCNMCGDGGDLICCDSCPSAIHQKCLNIQKFPPGDWNCLYCSCKFCGIVGGSTLDEDQNCGKSVPTLPACRLCEEKYHPLCAEGRDTSHKGPDSFTFCSQKCLEIFHQLEVLLGVKHQMEEGFSWTLIQNSDGDLDISSSTGAKNVECNAKLAVAWSVMDECFTPIVDQRSGINMIRNVVYSCGSNIRRLNYTGFFVAILERGDEIISAASIRIHGNLLAEMPFIGTRYTYRRQGMCRRLLNAIETALCSLNVEKLVLPAIPSLQKTWTSIFGFSPLEDSHKKEMKCMNMIAFPGVDMLQKPVVKRLVGIENVSSATDGKSNGAADVPNVSNPNSQVPDVFSNGPDMNCESVNCQDSVVIDAKDSKKDGIAPFEDASQLDNCRDSDESLKPEDTCEVAFNEDSKLYDQELAEVENITAVSETMSDPINSEMKTAHLSDVKEIADCVLNGEADGIIRSGE